MSVSKAETSILGPNCEIGIKFSPENSFCSSASKIFPSSLLMLIFLIVSEFVGFSSSFLKIKSTSSSSESSSSSSSFFSSCGC
jgi:hypothetical protein